MLTPSPHTSWHLLGAVILPSLHMKPVSFLHTSEHPSQLQVLPSSHSSTGVCMPSPQVGLQVSLPAVPCVQLQPVSTRQRLLHPSPLKRFPSSHDSKLSLIPLPQFLEQISAELEEPPPQDQVCSIVHDEEQPSPFSQFPSSHWWTVPQFSPSPQISEHEDFDELEHFHPGSIMQLLEHPSWFLVLPSSHSYLPRLIPSPQISKQASGDVSFPPWHANPYSTWQVYEQPSSFRVFPSSQA